MHLLAEQYCPLLHFVPHAPQLFGSLVKSAQVAPHGFCDAGHVFPASGAPVSTGGPPLSSSMLVD
jgi:hypothetical protein